MVTSPETVLPAYDLVFAKGKAAMEAMAVGDAVVLCDQAGAGRMVTSAQFDQLRLFNFGYEALREPLRREPLLREMARYDAADAERVRDLIRSSASLTAAVQKLVRIYEEVVGEQPAQNVHASTPAVWQLAIRQSVYLRLFWTWYRVPRRRREVIKGLPGVSGLIAAVRRLA